MMAVQHTAIGRHQGADIHTTHACKTHPLSSHPLPGGYEQQQQQTFPMVDELVAN
jgi:hypothetical protein